MQLLRQIPLDDITVPEDYPATAPAQVTSLAESIRSVGLLHPIIVTPDLTLVCGRHRLEACREVGCQSIAVLTMDANEPTRELAAIDENLERKTLPKIVQLQQLRRRKELYELIHSNLPASPGGSKKCGAGKNQTHQGGKNGKTWGNASFVKEAATKTGQSTRTVYGQLAVANKIADDVAEKLASHPVGNKQGELSELAELSAKQQREVVEKLQRGEADSVADAIAPVCPNCGCREVDADGDCANCHEPGVAPPEPKKLRDAKGRLVPAHLLNAFELVPEFKQIRRELGAILKRAEALAKSEGAAWLDIRDVRTHIKDAQHTIKFGTPYTVCRFCLGGGCARCRQSGYLNDTTSSRAG